MARAQSWVQSVLGLWLTNWHYDTFFPRVFRFSPVGKILPLFHTQPSSLQYSLREGQVGIAWEPSDNGMLLRISGSIGQKSASSL